MPTEIDCKTEVDLALKRAKEKLAEHEKTLKWHECFQTALDGYVYDRDSTMLLMIRNQVKIWCFKEGERFRVTRGDKLKYFFVWEKWFILHWKRTKFTFQETLNLLAEINVAGKALTFEVET